MVYQYACYLVHADGSKSPIYCESVKKYNPGDVVKTWSGETIVIDFELV